MQIIEDTGIVSQQSDAVNAISRFGGFYAVIPGPVMDDHDLQPNAKLMYAVISRLTMRGGYCWASNAFLGAELGLKSSSAAALIARLAEKKYIKVNVIRDEKNAVVERRISLLEYTPPLDLSGTPPLDLSGTPPLDLSGTPPLEISKENNKNFNNIYIPPKAPQGGQACAGDENASQKVEARGVKKKKAKAPMTETVHLPERFTGFWKYYCSVVPSDRNPGNKQAAMRAWDKLAPDAALVALMGKALTAQSQTDDWQRGIGVPHASTWLNGRRWEDPIHGGGFSEAEPAPRKEGWD